MKIYDSIIFIGNVLIMAIIELNILRNNVYYIFYLCRQLLSCDGMKYTELWRLIALYVEGSQEVVDSSSTLNLQQHTLIGMDVHSDTHILTEQCIACSVPLWCVFLTVQWIACSVPLCCVFEVTY